MHLPHSKKAEVPAHKITEYLLSSTHRAGKSKAAFFLKHGFTKANWRLLADSLRQHAIDNLVGEMSETPFGRRYVVDGQVIAPDGNALNVRTVWFIRPRARVPVFVTAHPIKR